MEPCDYCGKTDCRRCIHLIHNQMVRVFDLLEQAILKPDAVDGVGINNHLRAAWGARDAMNALLCGEPLGAESESAATAEGHELARQIKAQTENY